MEKIKKHTVSIPDYTMGEEIFNAISHGLGALLGVAALVLMVIKAHGVLPETAVSVVAAIQHKNTLAISNVVGSNIFNMMVVIGFCAIMTPVAVQKATLKRDFPYSVFAALLLIILGGVGMKLGRFDSAVFLVFFAIFIGTMIRMALKAGKEPGDRQKRLLPAASFLHPHGDPLPARNPAASNRPWRREG